MKMFEKIFIKWKNPKRFEKTKKKPTVCIH